MRMLCLAAIAIVTAGATPARADSCSDRLEVCLAACTPRQVERGTQFGGTVQSCRRSCQSRMHSCLKTGVWIHMGSTRRGEQEPVDQE